MHSLVKEMMVLYLFRYIYILLKNGEMSKDKHSTSSANCLPQVFSVHLLESVVKRVL